MVHKATKQQSKEEMNLQKTSDGEDSSTLGSRSGAPTIPELIELEGYLDGVGDVVGVKVMV